MRLDASTAASALLHHAPLRFSLPLSLRPSVGCDARKGIKDCFLDTCTVTQHRLTRTQPASQRLLTTLHYRFTKGLRSTTGPSYLFNIS